MAAAAGSHHHHRLLWQCAAGPRPSPRPAVARPRSSPTGGARPRPFPDSRRHGSAPSPTRGSADPHPSLISGVGPFPHARSAPRTPLAKGSCAATPRRRQQISAQLARASLLNLGFDAGDASSGFIRPMSVSSGGVGWGAAAMNSSRCERSFSTSLNGPAPSRAWCTRPPSRTTSLIPVTTGGRFRAFGSAAPRQDLLYAVTPSLNMCSVRHPQPCIPCPLSTSLQTMGMPSQKPFALLLS